MFPVPSNISAFIICSSKATCGRDRDSMSSSKTGNSIWYCCPLCRYRMCPGCTWATIETPPPMYDDVVGTEYQHSDEDTKRTDDKQEKREGMDTKSEGKHSGSTPVPGMVE